MNLKLRILFVGDSPTVATGFSKCTREVCNRLHANGHDVTVLGISYYGGPHDYPYAIYPCVDPLDRSLMVCGEQRLPKLIHRLNPDVVIILQDPWNINGYFREIWKYFGDDKPTATVIGWLAVDSKNQCAGRELNPLDHVVTWTEFGIDQLNAGGYTGPHSIIGLGVDTAVYYPMDRLEARRQILGTYLSASNIPPDAYIIGVVGRNQVRKRLDLNLEYFAEWIKRYEITDAYLCLHVGPTGESGVDIEKLCNYYGLKKVITLNPPLGAGVPESGMRAIYNMFDLYWSTSQAEGWNLPALEAMACGVPCLLPEQGAPAEWARGVACLVSCTSTALTAPLNGGPYTIGGIADREQTIAALDKLYRRADYRRKLSELGLQLASRLSWDRVGEQWEALLQSLMSTKVSPTMTDLMITPEAIESMKFPDFAEMMELQPEPE